MNKLLVLAFLSVLFFSCSKKVSTFSLQNKKIKELKVMVGEDVFLMSTFQQEKFLSCVSGAKYAGIWKGIRRTKVLMLFENGDTTLLHVMGSVFHLDSNWNEFYKFNYEVNFLDSFLTLSNKKNIDKNFAILTRIFENYIEYKSKNTTITAKKIIFCRMVF